MLTSALNFDDIRDALLAYNEDALIRLIRKIASCLLYGHDTPRQNTNFSTAAALERL